MWQRLKAMGIGMFLIIMVISLAFWTTVILAPKYLIQSSSGAPTEPFLPKEYR